jgi:hypothetical protein
MFGEEKLLISRSSFSTENIFVSAWVPAMLPVILSKYGT